MKEGKLVISDKRFRSIKREHIPKKTGNLEEPINNNKHFDNTHDRIHGIRRDEGLTTFNREYGVSKNPADGL